MNLATAYWILMLIWLVWGAVNIWPNFRAGGPGLILFLLLLIIGWKSFGPPLHS